METVSLLPVSAQPLTKGERGVLAALKRAIRAHGNPSLREIAACAEVTCYSLPSVPMIHRYLRRLEAKGFVELPPPNRARSIKLVRRSNGR